MGYVAARGGEQAIVQAEALYHQFHSPLTSEGVAALEQQLPFLLDRLMAESSLYAPRLAALALAQTGGDLYEATLILRAFRSTQPRLAYAVAIRIDDLLTIRRISAAFQDIPGGQILGPTLDYSHRLLPLEVLDGGLPPEPPEPAGKLQPVSFAYPAVTDWQRAQGYLPPQEVPPQPEGPEIPDLTREPMRTPASRHHRLQALARADSGGVLTLAYAGMRQYSTSHPTVNEVRLGYAPVRIHHPITGVTFSLGRIRVSHAEVVSPAATPAELELGFTAAFGWNEVKTISGAMLDLSMNQPEPHPAHTEDFVLRHSEPVDASGFCIHYKLPHYVTFASILDVIRGVGAQKVAEEISA